MQEPTNRRRRKRNSTGIDDAECEENSESDEDEREEDRWTLREGLQRVQDYRGLHPPVWHGLRSIHGGGPAIMRWKVNIYGERVGGEPTVTSRKDAEGVLVPGAELGFARNKRRKEKV